jgi:WD40 repeat protein
MAGSHVGIEDDPMRFGHRVRNVRNLFIGATVAVTLGGITWIAVGTPEQAAAVSAGAALLIAGGALVGDIFDLLRAGRREVAVEEVADQLATAVQHQWLAEATARGLRDTSVLPLRWAASSRKVGDAIETVVPLTAGRPIRAKFDGGIRDEFEDALTDLAEEYAKISSGRLVLLGEPGAGKTVLALLLTLGLIKTRPAGGRVPVLFSVSGWDPVLQDPGDWIVGALAAAYYNGQTSVPRELLRSNLIIPILDGLDEVSETSRRVAVEKINVLIRRDHPIVVTCRTNEYEDSIADGSPALSRAPVIEVQPVTPDDLAAYFGNQQWPAGTTWGAVLTRIRRQAKGPLALAFSTPLTVSLARLVYQRLPEKPAELLDDEAFDSRHAVEDSLAGRTVRAAYTDPVTLQPYRRAAQAERYLTELARYLHEHRERDYAWWRLADRRLSKWAGPTIGTVAGLLLMIAVAAWVSWFGSDYAIPAELTVIFGASVGGALAVMITVVWLAGAARPGRMALRAGGSGRRLRTGFRAGAGAVVVTTVPILLGLALTISITGTWSLGSIESYTYAVSAAAAIAILVGVAVAAQRWLDAGDGPARPIDPAVSLKLDRTLALVSSLVSAVVVGGLLIPALVGGLWLGSLAEDELTDGSGWPGAASPGLLWSARWFDVVERFAPCRGLLLAALGLLPAMLVLVLSLLSRPWPRYVIVTSVLGIRRQTPFRLARFLADAHDRGLLRRAAGTYQFRHVRLQEQLVTRAAVNRDRRWWGWADATPAMRVAVAAAVTLLVTAFLADTLPRNTAEVTLHGEYQDHITKYVLYQGKPGPSPQMTFTHDGRSVIVADSDDVFIRIFSTAGTLERSLRFTLPDVKVRSVTVAPDDTRLFASGVVGGDDRTGEDGVDTDPGKKAVGEVWDLRTGASLRQFDLGTNNDETSAQFSSDSRSLAVNGAKSKDATFRFWLLDLARPGPTIDRRVRRIETEGDSLLIFNSTDRAELWHMNGTRPLRTFSAAPPSDDDSTLALSSNGYVVSNSKFEGAQLWQTSTGAFVTALGPVANLEDINLYAGRRRAVILRPDGRFEVRDMADWRVLSSTPPVPGGLTGTLIDLDADVLAGIDTAKVAHVWHTDGKPIKAFLVPEDGDDLDSVSNLGLIVRNPNEQWLRVVPFDARPVTDVPDVSGFDDTTYWIERDGGRDYYGLWNNKLLYRVVGEEANLEEHLSGGRLATLLPDGRVEVRDRSTRALIARLPHDMEQTSSTLELGPNFVAPTSSGRIEIRSSDTGVCVDALDGHAGQVNDLELNKNESLLASSSTDGTVRLWRLGEPHHPCE